MVSTRTGLTMTEKAAKVQRKTIKTFRKPGNLLLKTNLKKKKYRKVWLLVKYIELVAQDLYISHNGYMHLEFDPYSILDKEMPQKETAKI